jgi:hypothetical protein
LIDAISKCVSANCEVFDPKYKEMKTKASGAGYFKTGNGQIDAEFWTWSKKALPFTKSLEDNLSKVNSIKSKFFGLTDSTSGILDSLMDDLNNPNIAPEIIVDSMADRLLSIGSNFNVLSKEIQSFRKKLVQSFSDLSKDEQQSLVDSGNTDPDVIAEKNSNRLVNKVNNPTAENHLNNDLTNTSPEIDPRVPRRLQ